MSEFFETDDRRTVLKNKLRQYFDGKIVRKDLTKKIKEGANVPVYVLEFLLGQYCSSDDPEIIEQGVENVKRILADNFVRPDEAQKILSVLRQRGSHTVIDMITVNLDIKHDCYVSDFSNLGLKGIPIDEEYPTKYDRLLCGGIWCIIQLDYEFVEEEKKIDGKKTSIFSFPYLWLGVFAIFFYVGAEVIAIDTLIPYGDFYGIPTAVSHYFGVYALIALLGGYICGILFVPKVISQRQALIIQLLLSVALVIVALCTTGIVSIIAIICLSFAPASMWPAIWPLAIHDLGDHTEFASALMVMAIVGGAVMPLIYGRIADAVNPHSAYALLFVSYAYILFFATVGYRREKRG